jgi:hypothetical protein
VLDIEGKWKANRRKIKSDYIVSSMPDGVWSTVREQSRDNTNFVLEEI